MPVKTTVRIIPVTLTINRRIITIESVIKWIC